MSYTEDQLNHMRELYEGGASYRAISRELGVDNDQVRINIIKMGIARPVMGRGETSAVALKDPTPGVEPDKVKGHRRFVITCALNNCPVDQVFLASLQTYCKVNKATLMVIPVQYKNVSLYHTDYQVEWPAELEQYYVTGDVELDSNLVILGSMRIQATASRPLQGTGGISKGKSAIFGHPRVALETIPTPLLKYPLVYATTGTVSEPSYSKTKAGRLGEFHHTKSAMVIETDGEYFWWRHVQANASSHFTDLDITYAPGSLDKVQSAKAVIGGDVHVGFHAKDACNAVFDRLVDKLNVKNVILEDVVDFFSASHHNVDNKVLQVMQEVRGKNDVLQELTSVAEWFHTYVQPGRNYFVIDSNHHNHITRWLDGKSTQISAKNLTMWHSLNAGRLKEAIRVASDPECKDQWHIKSPFEMVMDELLIDRVRGQVHFPDANHPLEFCGIDCSQHGHRGPNGARGSRLAFARSQRKTFVGHAHSPGITDGCYQVGHMTNSTQPYMEGYSGWLPVSGIIYADGCRTLIPVINGKCYLDDCGEE